MNKSKFKKTIAAIALAASVIGSGVLGGAVSADSYYYNGQYYYPYNGYYYLTPDYTGTAYAYTADGVFNPYYYYYNGYYYLTPDYTGTAYSYNNGVYDPYYYYYNGYYYLSPDYSGTAYAYSNGYYNPYYYYYDGYYYLNSSYTGTPYVYNNGQYVSYNEGGVVREEEADGNVIGVVVDNEDEEYIGGSVSYSDEVDVEEFDLEDSDVISFDEDVVVEEDPVVTTSAPQTVEITVKPVVEPVTIPVTVEVTPQPEPKFDPKPTVTACPVEQVPSPKTGNAPIALGVIPVALSAAAIIAKRRR